MKKLSKDLQREIADGQHSALMQGIEELIDMYNNKPWTDGYETCKDDVSVHSLRLAEHIVKEFKESRLHIDIQGKTIILNASELGKIIEEYFENTLKA